MSYLIGACGGNRLDWESNLSVHGRFVMFCNVGLNCRVIVMVKCSTQGCFGQLERMGENER